MRKNTANKGVTATSKDISETLNAENKNGIETIKEELVNVIELMGPSTPHLSSSDKDEITSIYSSLEVKSLKETIPVDTPRDISQMSALPIDISETTESKVENLNNINVYSTHEDHCPYRQYYNAMNIAHNVKAVEPKIQTYEKFNIQRMVEIKSNKEKGFSFLNLLKFRRQEKDLKEPLELYKINIQQNDNQAIPNKLTFDLIHDIPRPDMTTVATNTSKAVLNSPVYYQPRIANSPKQVSAPAVHVPPPNPVCKPALVKQQGPFNDKPTRVDVYYFDHGNACYFKTTDTVPTLAAEMLAEKTEAYTTKFWAEVFGTIHIFFAFLTTFILQFLKFILQSFIRPLTIGLLQLTSDYFFKPCLTVLFNAVIQPPAIFCFNVLTSIRDLCDPIAEGIGYFLREFANVCRSIRLIDVKNNCKTPTVCQTPFKSKIRRKK